MKKQAQKLFQFLYGPFFLVIDFFISNYRANRSRVQKLMGRQKASSFVQNVAVIVLIAWVLIYSFASEESRTRFTEAMKGIYTEAPSLTVDEQQDKIQ